METLCHQALGNFLLEMLKKDCTGFNRSTFLRGIRIPGVKELRRLKIGTSHTIDQSIGSVVREIDEICSEDNPRIGDISYRLGWVLHYVCDYFCLAHNLRYLIKNLPLHAFYERKMSCLVKKREILQAIWRSVKENDFEESGMKDID